jgi:hypothetical protein
VHREKSLREIGKMSPIERWQLARNKMSASDNAGVVSALLEHMKAHENTRWLVYRAHLSRQIPSSYAAHAFAELQQSALHYEIVRLCSFWDQVDLDSRSIPTIVALSDCSGVSQCVYDDHYSHYGHLDFGLAKSSGRKARRQLRTAIRGAKEIEESEILRKVKNYRDKLAHQLDQTNQDKKAAVPLPRYGDERKLLGKTLTAVNRLYVSLNGTGFSWDSAKAMHSRNAEAFWKGITIKVLR